MTLVVRDALPSDRSAFESLLEIAGGLEAYDEMILDGLTSYAFGPDAFVKVVMAEEDQKVIGAMAYYPGFNDAGLSINVVFLHVIEERRRSTAFRRLIGLARRIASERGAVTLNLAGAIFDERACGMLQSLKRQSKGRAARAGSSPMKS